MGELAFPIDLVRPPTSTEAEIVRKFQRGNTSGRWDPEYRHGFTTPTNEIHIPETLVDETGGGDAVVWMTFFLDQRRDDVELEAAEGEGLPANRYPLSLNLCSMLSMLLLLASGVLAFFDVHGAIGLAALAFVGIWVSAWGAELIDRGELVGRLHRTREGPQAS